MRARAAWFALLLLACSSDDTPAGPGPGAPTFAGVAAVAPAAENVLRVSWRPGNDAESGPDSLRYRIYVSVRGGRAIENPVVLTAAGATSAYVKVDPPNAKHFVTVRAVDPEGHEDGNRIERSAQAAIDTTPPTFIGVKNAELQADGAVKLTWDPASDDLTPPEGIRYAVFSGPDGTAIDYATPVAVAEGVNEVTVPNAIAVGQVRRFAVLAIDAAENRDTNTIALRVERDAVPTAPVFAGCSNVVARGSRGITVEWAAAQDDTTPADRIAYDVWIASQSGAQVLGGQPTATVTGATSLVISKLMPNITYFVICRARDENGNRDGNTAEKSAKTSDDATIPTFGGIDTFTKDENARTAKLTWQPATDDRTAAANIVYAVYERRGLAQYDFEKPRLVTGPNVLSIDFADLPSDTFIAWVVRARDEAYNEDANLQEKSFTTNVSFLLDIEPLYAKNCAVVGCHVSALPAGGLSLSTTVAYGNTVNVTAGQRPSDYLSDGGPTPPNIKRILPFSPDESYLLRKTQTVSKPFSNNPMPAPGTGNTLLDEDKARLKRWVEQGALNN